MRTGAGFHGKKLSEVLQDCELTEVLPISCSIPRTTFAHREGIIERYDFGLYVPMKDGSIVEDGRLICGKKIEPLTGQGG